MDQYRFTFDSLDKTDVHDLSSCVRSIEHTLDDLAFDKSKGRATQRAEERLEKTIADLTTLVRKCTAKPPPTDHHRPYNLCDKALSIIHQLASYIDYGLKDSALREAAVYSTILQAKALELRTVLDLDDAVDRKIWMPPLSSDGHLADPIPRYSISPPPDFASIEATSDAQIDTVDTDEHSQEIELDWPGLVNKPLTGSTMGFQLQGVVDDGYAEDDESSEEDTESSQEDTESESSEEDTESSQEDTESDSSDEEDVENNKEDIDISEEDVDVDPVDPATTDQKAEGEEDVSNGANEYARQGAKNTPEKDQDDKVGIIEQNIADQHQHTLLPQTTISDLEESSSEANENWEDAVEWTVEV